jgi:hypothetical protein
MGEKWLLKVTFFSSSKNKGTKLHKRQHHAVTHNGRGESAYGGEGKMLWEVEMLASMEILMKRLKECTREVATSISEWWSCCWQAC